MNSPTPLESILADMNRAIEARLYYPALLVALTIPEICCALLEKDATPVGHKRYMAFIDKYAPHGDPVKKIVGLGLSSLDCYRLRCGVVHRGNAAGHREAPWTHVLFSLPETVSVSFHGIQFQHGKNTA